MRDFSQLGIKKVKATFDEFNIDEKLDNTLKCFKEKIHTNNLKQTILNLQKRQLKKHLTLLKDMVHMVSFDITDEFLEEIVKPWNILKIDIKPETLKAIVIPPNCIEDHTVQYKINLNILSEEFNIKYRKRLKLSSIIDYLNNIFNNKLSKKPCSNVFVMIRDDFLNHETLFAEYDKKVKDFTKKLGEIFSINKSLRNFDFPSQTDIINEMASEVVCPKVAQHNIFNPTSDKWTPKFTADMKAITKLPDFKIDSNWNKCSSMLSKNSKKREGRFKSIRLTRFRKDKTKLIRCRKDKAKLTRCLNNDDYGHREKELFDLNTEKHPFRIPAFNFLGEKNVKNGIKQITQFLKGVCEEGMALKTLLNIKFDVSQIISATIIDIDFTTITFCYLKPSAPCLETQYTIEYEVKYQLMNPIDLSYYQRYTQNTRRGFYLHEHFLCSSLNTPNISQILRKFQCSIRDSLESLALKIKNQKKLCKNIKEVGLKYEIDHDKSELFADVQYSEMHTSEEKEETHNKQDFRSKQTKQSGKQISQ